MATSAAGGLYRYGILTHPFSSPNHGDEKSRNRLLVLSSSFKSLSLLSSSSFYSSTHSSSSCSSSFGMMKASNRFHRRRMTTVTMSMEAGAGLMGTKLGMMTYFEPEGTVVPVTVVGFREGNIVTQVKTEATDGYDAVQVGYRRVRDRKLTKPDFFRTK